MAGDVFGPSLKDSQISPKPLRANPFRTSIPRDGIRQISVDDGRHIAHLFQFAMFKVYGHTAELTNHCHVMANKEDRSPLISGVFHLSQRFALKLGVTDSQDLVNNQNIRFEMSGDSEGKPNVHTRGVSFNRGFENGTDVSEINNLIEFRGDFGFAHSEYGAI